jgi:hypothetical protein
VPHPDEPALVAYVADHTSSTALAVHDAADPAAARAALEAAAAEIRQIRHPDEPDASLPNWCEVLVEDGVPVLRLDMKDEIRYSALVVRIVLDRMAAAGNPGRVAPRRPPEPAFPYDGNPDLYTGLEHLPELDARGLPPGFPGGFPVPEDATLVLAQRCREDDAEHAAWRRSTGPFTGYLERLRAYGCVFGPVPRALTVGLDVRYTLWRDGAGGRVTLHRAGPSGPWYVGVVWQPVAEAPASTVDPDETPDARPVPPEPVIAREMAEFLVPPPLVAGFSTALALDAAGRALTRLMATPPKRGDRRPRAVVAAERVAPLLGRLDPDEVALVRHVCLTMVGNLLDSGRRARPAGLRLVTDEHGRRYAADVREHARKALEPALVAVVETAASLTGGAPMVADQLDLVRTAAVRPPADRWAWLFAGLAEDDLVTARDACWRLLEAAPA